MGRGKGATRATGGASTRVRRAASTERVMVLGRDFQLAETTLRPGALTEKARYVFSNGQCHALAAALHEHTGWPVVVLVNLGYAHRNPDMPPATPDLTHALHVLVRAPDGRLLDINGASNEADVCGGWERDLAGQRVSVIEPPARWMTSVLAGSDGWLPPATTLARSLCEPLLECWQGTRPNPGDPRVTPRQPSLQSLFA